MANKTYSDKLKDPRWQKKRLEVLKRDKWTCRFCGDKESTLHVHHMSYSSKEPWETPQASLVTLCERCHQYETENRKEAEAELLSDLREWGFSSGGINCLAMFATQMLNRKGLFRDAEEFASFIRNIDFVWEKKDTKMFRSRIKALFKEMDKMADSCGEELHEN